MLILTTTGLIAGELVTERRHTEFQLRLHKDSLSRVAQIGGMGELTVAIAHELNQPLMAARTYTRLVEEAVSSGDEDRYSIERIIKETLALCQPDLDRSHASARAVIASDLPPVKVDILQIQQVLLNLVNNSIEATDKSETINRTILIEALAASAGFVEVRVSDNGPGFPPDLLSDSFLPFFSTKAEGLGFGLSLCKSVVGAHGGHLWLDRNVRGGAVHFTLPVAEISHDG
jgi:two-component system sensor kinase FixL